MLPFYVLTKLGLRMRERASRFETQARKHSREIKRNIEKI